VGRSPSADAAARSAPRSTRPSARQHPRLPDQRAPHRRRRPDCDRLLRRRPAHPLYRRGPHL